MLNAISLKFYLIATLYHVSVGILWNSLRVHWKNWPFSRERLGVFLPPDKKEKNLYLSIVIDAVIGNLILWYMIGVWGHDRPTMFEFLFLFWFGIVIVYYCSRYMKDHWDLIFPRTKERSFTSYTPEYVVEQILYSFVILFGTVIILYKMPIQDGIDHIDLLEMILFIIVLIFICFKKLILNGMQLFSNKKNLKE